MKIYICCPIPAAEEAKRVKAVLIARGHKVIARWIDDPNTGYESGVSSMQERAVADFEDVQECELLVVLSRPGSRGGTHTELGLGLAWGKKIFLIGERTNVFHSHPSVVRFATLAEALEVL